MAAECVRGLGFADEAGELVDELLCAHRRSLVEHVRWSGYSREHAGQILTRT